MNSSAEQQHKSYELNHVSAEELINLYNLGFNIIPLKQDSQTPNVHSTNDIYNNPGYWSDDKLRNSRHLFYNVATLSGKSYAKDKDGRDLYLNGLDIDSDPAFTRLARITHKDKDVYLIDELCKSTYVVKIKKRFSYRLRCKCKYHEKKTLEQQVVGPECSNVSYMQSSQQPGGLLDD